MRYRVVAVWLLAGWVCLGLSSALGAEGSVKPVTPNAAPEAVELLKFIHGLSGKHALTGQHNFPNTKGTFTQQAAQSRGKMPAGYGQDWGFAQAGNQGSYLARPDIVAECKQQYALGAIVTICWHGRRPKNRGAQSDANSGQ